MSSEILLRSTLRLWSVRKGSVSAHTWAGEPERHESLATDSRDRLDDSGENGAFGLGQRECASGDVSRGHDAVQRHRHAPDPRTLSRTVVDRDAGDRRRGIDLEAEDRAGLRAVGVFDAGVLRGGIHADAA